MDLCHLKNPELEPQFQKYKGRVVLPWWNCKRWFWILCSIHGAMIISITNDGRKGHGYLFQTARLRRTISWRSVCFFSCKNGRFSTILENSKIGMSRHLDSSTTTYSSMEDPVAPLERNLYGHCLAGLLWERQFEKVLLKNGWEKVPTWEWLFVNLERTTLVCVCGRLKTG